jgi:hypothetical protein
MKTFSQWLLCTENYVHPMSASDWDDVGMALRNPEKAKQIETLLIEMFPEQKDIITYNYKNDSFAEMKRFIHGIDKYGLEGPSPIQPMDIKLEPEIEKEREIKYQQYVNGKIDHYFRDDKTDPRNVDVSKFPPIEIDEKGFVSNGAHRAFIAKKQDKPLMAYRFMVKTNTHPNVQKILDIVRTNDKYINSEQL